MKVAMKRAVIGLCSAGALTVAACGDGGRVPTSPSPGGVVSRVGLDMAGAGAQTADASGKNRPFKGSLSLELIGEPAFEPPATVSVHFKGEGNATHLGRFTATLDIEIDVSNEPTETSHGTVTLSASNGDNIFGALTGHAVADGDVTTIVESVTITGGTGRFAQASGHFVINRTSLPLELPPGSFEGTISY